MKNIFAIILLIASVALFFVYVDPTYQNDKALAAEDAQYQTALTNSKELLSERDKLLSKLNTFSQNDVNKVETLLPDSVDSVTLVIELESIAEKFGMHVRDFVASDSAAAGSLGTNSTPYGTLELTFTTTASYQTFLAFLQALESDLRLIEVTGVSFNSSSNNAIYDFTVTVKTYWLK